MIYLTCNDAPSGIFSSQVVDVCNFLNKRCEANIRLVALLSLRGFSANRAKIRNEFPSAIILPMFPGPQNWRWNKFLLFLLFVFLGKQSVIARGPFAASLALSLKKAGRVQRVCFDARGAYDSEFHEYDVANSPAINNEIFSIEKNALVNSDFRIAVSAKLVEYWKLKFGYSGEAHVVIPCTLKLSNYNTPPEVKVVETKRALLGYSETDVVYVYAGSSSEWQSLGLVDDFLTRKLQTDTNAKVLLLIREVPEKMTVAKAFPRKVTIKWVKAGKMPDILSCCDYGLLIRNNSVTNSVASPVKFAEYLAAGLKIIISSGIGDYSDFVKAHDCGRVLSSIDDEFSLSAISLEERKRNIEISGKKFSKENYLREYSAVLQSMGR
ncbi:MAG: hypothetical protein EPN85_04405 [Bacteroidetes bacterium]|nr:MAG: hypothetical protein EPN85_04405 [Bacteroidota bacterium]